MTATVTTADLAERVEYLRRRWEHRRQFRQPRMTGLSSDALVAVGLGWITEPDEKPADRGDLDACIRSYQRAPDSMKPAMRPWLETWCADQSVAFPGPDPIDAEKDIPELWR